MNHMQYETAFHPGPFQQQTSPFAAAPGAFTTAAGPPLPQENHQPYYHQQQQQHQQHQHHHLYQHPPPTSSPAYTSTHSGGSTPAHHPVPQLPHHVSSQASIPHPTYDGSQQGFAPLHPGQQLDGAGLQFATGQQPQHHNPYTSVPVPAQASSPAPTPSLRQSASPSQHYSPYAHQLHGLPQPHQQSGPASQHSFSQDTPPPQQKHPMAAPPLPQTPASQHQGYVGAGSATASPSTPQSPASQNREQKRVALLLDINMDLLQEISNLQASGKGGATSPQQLQQLKNAGQPSTMASEEYIQCLRRVQANMSYLVPVHSGTPGKKPPGPVHMTPPPHMPKMQAKYEQLKELFPGWLGYDQRASGQGAAIPQGIAGSPSNSVPTNGMNFQSSNAPSLGQM